MREIDVEEAAGCLSRLIEELGSVDEVLLTRDGERVAKLMPLPPRQQVRLGLARGQFTVPEDFDAPLPDDLLDLFYRGPIVPDDPPLWPEDVGQAAHPRFDVD